MAAPQGNEIRASDKILGFGARGGAPAAIILENRNAPPKLEHARSPTTDASQTSPPQNPVANTLK